MFTYKVSGLIFLGYLKRLMLGGAAVIINPFDITRI